MCHNQNVEHTYGSEEVLQREYDEQNMRYTLYQIHIYIYIYIYIYIHVCVCVCVCVLSVFVS